MSRHLTLSVQLVYTSGMTTTAVPTITTNQIKTGDLADDVTGVRWVNPGRKDQHFDWTECREHLLDPSWSMQISGDDEPTGVALTDEVQCDACAERDA